MKNFLTRRNDESNWGLNFFDNAFDDFFAPVSFNRFFRNESMRTDIRETDKGYELSVDMPGFDKKDISLSLENGYITISAKREEKEDDKNYLRRERSYSCERSYYVGENVTEDDIKAKYNNGTLTLDFPKNEINKLPKKHIEID